MRLTLLLPFSLLGIAPGVHADDDYTASIEQWHAHRVESLKKSEGWLGCASSGFINLGKSTIESASDNTIVLTKGLDHPGTLVLNKAGVTKFRADSDSDATINGKPIKGKLTLKDNEISSVNQSRLKSEPPTIIFHPPACSRRSRSRQWEY